MGSEVGGAGGVSAGRYTSMVFPIWFEDLRQTVDQQEKEYVEGVKKERERRCREGLQQGRSEKELDALLKQEIEKDKERDLRLCWRIKPNALLSEERPRLLPVNAVLHPPTYNPDEPVFPTDKVVLCGLHPANTLFVTAMQLDCYNMYANIDPKRCHRWSIMYRVANDLDAIPIEKPLHVDMYTHGICVNATTLSNKLNNFVIITDRYVDITIHGNELILFQVRGNTQLRARKRLLRFPLSPRKLCCSAARAALKPMGGLGVCETRNSPRTLGYQPSCGGWGEKESGTELLS
jgi:hypothetical protein